jgi:hypothetical protein
MRHSLVLPSLLALTISVVVSGTALTYKLSGNEKSCFFTDVPRPNAKVAFYFAVCIGDPPPPPPLYSKSRAGLIICVTTLGG